MEKVKIVVTGERVHEVGYRVFLLNNALNFGIDRFNAYNAKENGMPAVIVLLEADEEIINDFYEFINKVYPENATVSEIRKEEFRGRAMNIEQYMHLAMVEQLDKGIPAILDIKSYTSQIPAMRDDISDIKSYTSQIPAMKDDISDITSYTSQIPAMKDDTAAIKSDTREIASKLWEKYEELSKEIAPR